jgi:hypothetical protein
VRHETRVDDDQRDYGADEVVGVGVGIGADDRGASRIYVGCDDAVFDLICFVVFGFTDVDDDDASVSRVFVFLGVKEESESKPLGRRGSSDGCVSIGTLRRSDG